MDTITAFFNAINGLTWGWGLIPLLIIFGVFFTLMTGFSQLRFFGRMFAVLSGKEDIADPSAISARQALFVSIGGRVGGGNIAGVAVAITLGGPGAVFWMWFIALLGMATSIVECSLAQLYKRSDPQGGFRGGPAQYIIHGLGDRFKWLAVLYAICLIAAFALGFPAFQGNTMAGAVEESTGINRIVSGIALSGVTGLIIFGGMQRIAKVSDIVVPVMALLYIATALIIIVMNIGDVPDVFGQILRSAFGLEEAVAGGMGAAIAQGMRRGLFSNEAGLGSAPNVAAAAYVRHPLSQGITQSFSVFIDTIIICSCTAFVILLGDVYVPGAAEIDGVVLTQRSMVGHLGSWAAYVLTIAILLFAFSSIIYSYYLGENALAVITKIPGARLVLQIAVMGVVLLGAVAPSATSVFFFSDPLMGILAVVNLMAICMLFPTALRLIDDYRSQVRAGKKVPELDIGKYSDLNIDPEVWGNKAK